MTTELKETVEDFLNEDLKYRLSKIKERASTNVLCHSQLKNTKLLRRLVRELSQDVLDLIELIELQNRKSQES